MLLIKSSRIWALVVVLCSCASMTFAQPAAGLSPGATQKRSQDTLEFLKLESVLDKSREDEAKIEEKRSPEVDKKSVEVAKTSFLLKKIVTNDSSILSADEIRSVAANYENREVTVENLFELVDELNKLYAEHQALTARAFLLPQKVTDGVVEIRLVESRLGKVIIEGNADTSSEYILEHFSLGSGELLTLDELEGQLRRFNRLNDVLVKAELRRGEEVHSTDCLLNVTEPLPYSLVFYSDNAGEDETGKERVGALFTVRSLFGRRDPLTLGVNASRGTRAATIAYSLPVHRSGTRLFASYNVDTIKIIDGTFEPLNITGESTDLEVHLSQPLMVTTDAQLVGRVGFHWKKSMTDFDDVMLFENKVRSAFVNVDYQRYAESSVLFLKGEVTQGFDDFGGDKSFLKANLGFAFNQQLPHGFSALVRGAGQLSDRNLLPATEQFQLGGLATVRGYSEGIRLGDDGYFASVELHAPMPDWRMSGVSLREKVQGVLFVDHGGAFPFKGKGESIDHTDFLTSVGLGFLCQFSQYLSGRVYFGVPLGEREENQDDVKLHFYVQSRFL